MFRSLVTKLQEDDAIRAITPSLFHEFLFTEFKPLFTYYHMGYLVQIELPT